MNFEKLQHSQKEMDESAELELADKFEYEKNNEIKKEIEAALDVIRDTELFEKEYIDNITLVARDSDGEKYKFDDGEVKKVKKDEYYIDDFMQGRRVDFVGIAPKEDFEIHMEKAFKKKAVFEVAFFDNVITYEEFIVHEMAHNIFDMQYIQENGKYDEIDGKNDVSNKYREQIKDIITTLVNKHYPKVEMDKFSFSRQQISEIFAMLYQREFCRRSNINVAVHDELDVRAISFFNAPLEMLNKFNEDHNHDFTMEGHIYEENHVLSLVVALLLEEKYPEWKDRMDIF